MEKRSGGCCMGQVSVCRLVATWADGRGSENESMCVGASRAHLHPGGSAPLQGHVDVAGMPAQGHGQCRLRYFWPVVFFAEMGGHDALQLAGLQHAQ